MTATENKTVDDATAAQEANPAVPAQKPFVSTGYRIHNEITYRGIDWLLNSTVGVATTYWAARTPSGEKYFQKPVSNFFKKVLAPVLKEEKNLAEGAKWGTSFASIMAGGFAIIPLMTFMEDKKHKRKAVRRMDEILYGKEAVANDPKFEESYCRIDDEPRKNFMTGMAARFIAIAPLIAVASIPATNKRLIKYIYDPIGNTTKKVAQILGIKPGEKMMNPVFGKMEHLDGDPNTPKQMQSNWDFLHRTIGFDFGLTVFYAILHEMSYKSLAKRFAKPEESKAAVSDVSVSTQQAANNGAAPDDALSAYASSNTGVSGSKDYRASVGGSAKPRPQKPEGFANAVEAGRADVIPLGL
jgi:hypothetical protein